MKKIAIIVISVLVGLVILYLVINLWDSKLNPDIFTLADLPNASVDKSNGFYILWGLAEPADVDVQSEEYTSKIRKLLEPESKDNNNEKFNYEEYKNKFKPYKEAIEKIKYPPSFETDWITALSSEADKIEKARQEAALPLRRYQQLIDTPTFEEFTRPRFSAPIPNLLAFQKLARLYTAGCTTDAVNGKWEEAVGNLCDHIDFTKRVIVSGRALILRVIAKAAMKYSLQGLVSILNHPECPESVYPLVLSRMPPLKYEEYGSRNSLIFECLCCFAAVEQLSEFDSLGMDDPPIPSFLPPALLFQKNRTKNYFNDFYSMMVAYDMLEPYRWEGDTVKKSHEAQEMRHAKLWWLQNPMGKILFTSATPNISKVIALSYRTRAYYDMTRILAEFQMNYSEDKSAADILKELESYKKNHDPCSGNPYAWNNEKHILYSIATDRVDNGGIGVPPSRMTDIDFAIPVVLKTGTVKQKQ